MVLYNVQDPSSLAKLIDALQADSEAHIAIKGCEGSDTISQLAPVFRKTAKLESLDLSRNKFIKGPTHGVTSKAAINAVAWCLRNTKSSLRSLNLSNLGITDALFQRLSTSIRELDRLEELNLNGNAMQAPGVVAALETLRDNDCIQSLLLDGKPFTATDDLTHAICRLIEKKHSLLTLSVCDATFSSSAIAKFAGSIKANTTLQRFDLSGNKKIRHDDKVKFAFAIEMHPRLRSSLLDTFGAKVKKEARTQMHKAKKAEAERRAANLNKRRVAVCDSLLTTDAKNRAGSRSFSGFWQALDNLSAISNTQSASLINHLFDSCSSELKQSFLEKLSTGLNAEPSRYSHLYSGTQHLAKGQVFKALSFFGARCEQVSGEEHTEATVFRALCLVLLDRVDDAGKAMESISLLKLSPEAHFVKASVSGGVGNHNKDDDGAAHLECCGHALLFLSANLPWKKPNAHAQELLNKHWSVLEARANVVRVPKDSGSDTAAEEEQKQEQKQETTSVEHEWTEKKATIMKARCGKKEKRLCSSMDDLMKLTGLMDVKKHFLDTIDRAGLAHRQGDDPSQFDKNVVFVGNPGTGKTTVARLYAQILEGIGMLPSSKCIETSGSALLSDGVDGLKKMLQEIKTAKGGLLFVDEAYQLNPKLETQGRRVLDYLLTEAENNRTWLAIVFAGYIRPMEELFEHNEGLASRFSLHWTFADYTYHELLEIFMNLLGKYQLRDDKSARILCRRLDARRGRPGFGNARAVRNQLDIIKKRQSARIRQQEKEENKLLADSVIFYLERDDVLGPKSISLDSSQAYKKLMAMEGLAMVKESIEKVLNTLKVNVELEENEKPVQKLCLNKVFLGNPGTGKTTVARLYGEILRDLGLLSKGKFIIKNPSDFIGDVIGASEKQTNAILDNAIGSVLVIDEAYGLLGTKGISSFKEAVIDTIVSKIQNVPGDDRCVLLLGYQEEMNRLFNECHNPGLKGRFDAQNPFVFEDFDDDQLFSILQMKAKEAHLDISMDASMKAISILGKQRMQKHFANGRAVCTLLNAAMQHMSQRNIHDLAEIKGGKQIEVTVADFEKCMPTATADPKELFGDLIGVQKLLDRIQKLTNNIKYAQRLGQDPLSRMDLTFAFVGRPGTGKTTVAERMGTLFSALGLLASAEVISISASQLQTGFVGQAGGQTRKIFDSALGKVLFIDEAYRLNPGIRQHNYMREVVDEIVNLLTEPAFKNKLVVIFAGYKKEMMEMLQANSGLRSRVPNVWEFEDFNAQDSTMILQAKLKANSLLLSAEAEAMLPGAMQQCIDGLGNDWSNGRSVSNWATKIISQVAQRVMAKETKTGEKQDLTSGQKVIPEDLSATLEALLSTLAGDDADTDAKTIITEVHLPSAVMPAPMHQHAPSFSVKATSKQTQASRAALEEKEKEKETETNALEVAEAAVAKDAGVTDTEWIEFKQMEIEMKREDAERQNAINKAREALKLAEKLAREADEKARAEAERKAREEKERLARLEAETRRLQKLERERQKKLRCMGMCRAGFRWIKISEHGYRCAGGSHYHTFKR